MISTDFVEQFCGTWELVNYHILNIDGVLQTEDPRIIGRLIYCPDGSMSVVITRGKEATTSLSDVVAYSGKYKIEGFRIDHIIEVSSVSTFYDSVQIREFRFVEGILELSTVGRLDGQHVLRWRRSVTYSK